MERPSVFLLCAERFNICHCPQALYFDSICVRTPVGVSQGYSHLSTTKRSPFNTLVVNHSVRKPPFRIPLPLTFPELYLTLQWFVVCGQTTRPSQQSTNMKHVHGNLTHSFRRADFAITTLCLDIIYHLLTKDSHHVTQREMDFLQARVTDKLLPKT